MRDDLQGIVDAIADRQLPDTSEDLFGSMWDAGDKKFVSQETYVFDFKDRVPDNFTSDFGASIVRLVFGFHNTFGGLIIFGIKDDDFTSSGLAINLNVEALSDIVTELSASTIELIFREYRLPGTDDKVGVLLIPRRGHVPPIQLERDFASYQKGTIWTRDRHSIRELREGQIPLLFSDRSDLTRSVSDEIQHSIHESLPPSPATIQRFVGRKDLLLVLWRWFVFGDKPRLYLHGPGGSGKSTLAYEFSRTVANRGSQVVFKNGEVLDYVIYISGKESELNTYTGVEQPFSLRQFDDARSQYEAILVDSFLYQRSDIEQLSESELLTKLEELFNNQTGLLVIDDIDALSRRGKDTAEESLLYSVIKASKRTRILYTLRFPPTSALNSSVMVPALDSEYEFPEFVEICAKQFDVPLPVGKDIKRISEMTSRLPLLTETVIGLRGLCGSYTEALEQFRDRGGDEARQYLYQREYDRLEPGGRSREVLAALLLLEGLITFPVLTRILGMRDEHVRDAISESGSIFLASQDDGRGETHYQLTSPAKPFIHNVSTGLPLFQTIKRRVELYLEEGAAYTPEESALIVQLDRLVRARNFREAVDTYEGRDRRDPVLTNQKVQALVGQSYANLGPDYRTKARECFDAASGLNYFDIFMARSWFFVEKQAEYGNQAAIDVCLKYLSQPKLAARYKAEFKSKLASCYFEEAKRMRYVSKERSIEFFQNSIMNYLSALWIGRYTDSLDTETTLRWLYNPAAGFSEYLRDDVAPYFEMLSILPDQKHDIHLDGAEVLMQAMLRLSAPRDAQGRARFVGVIRRTIRRLTKALGDSDETPGFRYLVEKLSATIDTFNEATASSRER